LIDSILDVEASPVLTANHDLTNLF